MKKDRVTTIRIWESTKKKLDKEKQNELESYNDVIRRLLRSKEALLEMEEIVYELAQYSAAGVGEEASAPYLKLVKEIMRRIVNND